MQLFLPASAGTLLMSAAETIGFLARWAINLTVGIAIVLLLARWLIEALQINPFGRVAYYLRRPTDDLLGHARNSRFYYPLRQALKFNPAILIALVGLVIVWYVMLMLLGNLMTVIGDVAMVLDAFGEGRIFNGLLFLIGTLLMGVIFFLMSLMMLIFVNWIAGLFDRASFRALQRLGPLLRVFEFGGTYANWSFLLLWLALYIASMIVQSAFFRNFQLPARQF